MMLELRTPWPVLTPKGPAKVYVVESLSIDTPVYYHVFVDATGEPWVFRQQDVRLAPNETEGRQAFADGKSPLHLKASDLQKAIRERQAEIAKAIYEGMKKYPERPT